MDVLPTPTTFVWIVTWWPISDFLSVTQAMWPSLWLSDRQVSSETVAQCRIGPRRASSRMSLKNFWSTDSVITEVMRIVPSSPSFVMKESTMLVLVLIERPPTEHAAHTGCTWGARTRRPSRTRQPRSEKRRVGQEEG